jgi:hypothetical protein
MASITSSQMRETAQIVEPPSLEKVLAIAKTPNNAQLAELMAIKLELPLGPIDVLKGYEHGMALIAQRMSADIVNVSRAAEANQLTHERAEYLIGERYLILLCYKKGVPQKGQPESCQSKTLAMVCRRVAMDQGLCRSTRTGRTPRTEVAWPFGDG